MFIHRVSQSVAALALTLVASFCFGDPTGQTRVSQLKRNVEEREHQLILSQLGLADARARLALAEGKRDLAIAHVRSVVDGYQAEIQWIRDHANRFCDPRDLMFEAQWNLAKSRVWLAELEGDNKALVVETKKLVGFHEQQLERVRQLELALAVSPQERVVAQKALDEARSRLLEAEKKLMAEQAE